MRSRDGFVRGGSTKRARRPKVYAHIFKDRFYLELQDNRLHAPLNDALREIGRTAGLPLVATNDCHYLHRGDARAHEVLLCIQTGKTLADESRWRFDTDELYVKTPEEMATAFGADSEEFRNTMEIARRVDFEFEFGKFHFPIYQDAPPDDLDQVLETRVKAGLEARLAEIHARRGEFDEAPYYERLDARIAGHPRDGLFGLHADRRRLYRLRAQPGHPGRTGPRLGGRQPGLLCAQDNRGRSDRA